MLRGCANFKSRFEDFYAEDMHQLPWPEVLQFFFVECLAERFSPMINTWIYALCQK